MGKHSILLIHIKRSYYSLFTDHRVLKATKYGWERLIRTENRRLSNFWCKFYYQSLIITRFFTTCIQELTFTFIKQEITFSVFIFLKVWIWKLSALKYVGNYNYKANY